MALLPEVHLGTATQAIFDVLVIHKDGTVCEGWSMKGPLFVPGVPSAQPVDEPLLIDTEHAPQRTRSRCSPM